DGPRAFWPAAIKATTPEEGRQAVRTLKQKKADFIKVYDSLSPETYRAVVDEAKKQGLPVEGHCPLAVPLAEGSDAGRRTVEHLAGLALACAKDGDALRRELAEALAKGPYDFALVGRLEQRAWDGFDRATAEDLFARLARNRTWQVPTLTVLRALASADDPRVTGDERLRYMPGFLKSGWTPEALRRRFPPEA